MNYQFPSNPLQYAANEQASFTAALLDNTGYQTISTFAADLSIAEAVGGVKGIKDTYDRVCKSWLSDHKMFTEFVLALNHKCWQWYDRMEDELSRLYSDLYEQADQLAYSSFTPDQQRYYFQVTD